jgi:hypothetical protein
MEVHAHTHTAPASGGTGRKKWTHYLWEFLMLFLAVFCGFLAENQREHMIEHQREKKFISSIVQDIKSDTALLKKTLAFNTSRIKTVDTLLEEMSKPGLLTDSRRAYELANQSGFWDFVSNDGTLQQLKNGGGLRLIRNQNVVDKIMSYDKQIRSVYGNQDGFNQFMLNLIDNNLKFFPTMSLERIKDKPIPLLLKDKQSIETYYGFEAQYQVFLYLLTDAQTNLLTRGEKLITLIEQEYHLE